MSGSELIAEERKRQIEEEGYDEQRDAEYVKGELVKAAVCYALTEEERRIAVAVKGRTLRFKLRDVLWPWKDDSWKPVPGDRLRELVKAGALIASEIDRLQRAFS